MTISVKIGYPCINRSIGCQADHTFRLKSYSEKRLTETIEENLACLLRILQYNIKNNLRFFRITSDIVPFASHPINKFNWHKKFEKRFKEIGDFIRVHDMRISMHPDQFTLINSPGLDIFKRSIAELRYHAEVLDLMGLDKAAKIQIHVGGVYKKKEKSIKRFIARYRKSGKELSKRLVIENDERSYTLGDCLLINNDTGIPVLFDSFHHELHNNGEEVSECLQKISKTWNRQDGIPMVDFSHQKYGATKGAHADTIKANIFRKFLEKSKPYNFDIMLEIKDKERSALKAAKIAQHDSRFHVLNGNED